MNIAVDATIWQNNRGYGRHARALLTALAKLETGDRLTFFVDSLKETETIPKNVSVHHVPSSKPAAIAAAADGHRALADLWNMSRALSSAEFDVVFFPTVYSYVPVFSRAAKVIMFHDVIAEKFPELTIPNRVARSFWQAKVWAGRRQARAIGTVSEYSRQQLADYFHIPPAQIYVVGEASDTVFRKLTTPQISSRLLETGIPQTGRLLVYVGGFGPHKNLEQLVDVFAKVANQPGYEDICLVMVGEYKKEIFFSEYEELSRRIEAHGLNARVIFTGYLPDEELVLLLNLAVALVLPSLMEGFGLPAVEAAACGCPVIATRESPLPQLLGAGGVYIDPRNPIELEQAIIKVLSFEETRNMMRNAGVKAASQLTWEAAAVQLKDLLHSAAAR